MARPNGHLGSTPTRLFRLAASDCPHGFIEWGVANAELKDARRGALNECASGQFFVVRTKSMRAEEALAFLDDIVDPTIIDFEKHPASRRHAFLACVAAFHCVDYLNLRAGHKNNLRNQFRKENADFAVIERVAQGIAIVKEDNSACRR
jgi:hypothetical protein